MPTGDSVLSPLQHELRDATRSWGCPLCRLDHKVTDTFIDSMNYERILDLKTRDALKAARGLCDAHSRQWQALNGSALGIAIVNHISILDLLRETGGAESDPAPDVSRQMARSRRGLRLMPRRGDAQNLADQLELRGKCPACALGQSTAEQFADLLLKEIKAPDYAVMLEKSGGLCLDHFRMALRRPHAGATSSLLLEIHRKAWQTLRDELEEFIRKNDYRYADEKLTQEEGTSWQRVLDVLVGWEDLDLDRYR